jgi:hypothetical protein
MRDVLWTGLVLLGVIASSVAVIFALLLAFARVRRRCPLCRQSALVLEGAARISARAEAMRRCTTRTSYRCTSCSAELFEYGDNGLITRAAYEAGATQPIPPATVVRAAPRRGARAE